MSNVLSFFRFADIRTIALFGVVACSSSGLVGCKKSTPSEAPPPSPSASSTTSPSASASVTGASAALRHDQDATAPDGGPPGCTVKSGPTVIDRYVRLESGLTVTQGLTVAKAEVDGGPESDAAAPAKRPLIALGYARALGKPAVAGVDETGEAKVLTVASSLEALENKPATNVRRVVRRVVPLAFTATGAEAAVDYVDVGPEKARAVHCGPANGTAWVSASGPSPSLGAADATHETLECASAGAGSRFAESRLSIVGDELVAQVLIDNNVALEEKVKLAGNEKQMERYAFTMLGFSADGRVATARYNGKVYRFDVDRGTTISKWLGAAASGMASGSGSGKTLVTLQGKTTVHAGGNFGETRSPKGTELQVPFALIELPTPDGLEERSAPAAIDATYGAVREKIGGTYSARVFSLVTYRTAFTVERPGATLHALQVVELPNRDVFVATLYLDPKKGGTLDGTVMTCPEH